MLRLSGLSGPVRPDAFANLALIAAFLLAGSFAGVTIASGKPTMIALTIGAVVGVFLLNFPAFVMWLVLLGTLMISGPLMFHIQGTNQLTWAFSLLGMSLMIMAFMHVGLQRPDRRRPVPGFVLLGCAFVAYGLVSAMWFDGTSAEALGGAKRYYQFFGIMFALAMIRFREQTVWRWMSFLVLLSFLSIAPAIYQRMFLATRLMGGMDSIVGFFELSIQGTGSSGVLAFMQITMVGVLIGFWREGRLSLANMVLACAFVLIPLLIGEVNVMFIWLPLCVCAAFLDLIRKRPALFFLGGIGAVVCMVLFSSVYVLWQQSTRGAGRISADRQLEQVLSYNFGDVGYGHAQDLNRKTVYPYWAQHHGMSKPIQTMFGHGIGSGWPVEASTSPTVIKHRHVHIGLTAASLLLWDLGVVGLVLYLAMMGSAWVRIMSLSMSAPAGRDRVICRGLLCSATLLMTNIFYSNSAFGFPSMGVLSALTLGFIAWMDRRQFRLDSQLTGEPAVVATESHEFSKQHGG